MTETLTSARRVHISKLLSIFEGEVSPNNLKKNVSRESLCLDIFIDSMKNARFVEGTIFFTILDTLCGKYDCLL